MFKKPDFSKTKLLLAALTLFVSTMSQAAPILLHQPGTAVGPFTMGTNEVRQTHLEVLNTVTITSLGAEINPGANSIFSWRIYESNATNAIVSTIFTQTGISFTDVGLDVYDTALSVLLNPGFYLIELHNTGSLTEMQRYNEINQGLPFVSTDGNFRVINGCASGSGPGVVSCGNTILPAFSVSTTAVVDEPAPLALLGAGLLLIGFAHRRKTNG